MIFYTGLGSGQAIALNGNRSVTGVRFNDLADQALTFSGNRLSINSDGITEYRTTT